MIALFPAFPSAPVISGGDHLTLGEESTLSCRVSDVYPAELITLTWLRGATVLQSTMGEPGSSSVQSRYQLQPEKRDSGVQITCRATLDLQDLLSEERIKETSITLNVLCEFRTWWWSDVVWTVKNDVHLDVSAVHHGSFASNGA